MAKVKTINPLFYEKMVEAKQTYCAFCMRGSMPFWEDCNECKVSKMLEAVRAVVQEETTNEEKAAVQEEVSTSYDEDLPRKMISSIGQGPRTEEGFKSSPFFVVSNTATGMSPVKVKLVEKPTGFPDCEPTETTNGSQSKVHYLFAEKGDYKEDIQLWDLNEESLREQLQSIIKG